MQSGIFFIVAWIVIVLLCLVYTYFLILSLSVIAGCFVSFILVQFFFSSVFMLQFCLLIKEKEEEEEEEERERERERENFCHILLTSA